MGIRWSPSIRLLFPVLFILLSLYLYSATRDSSLDRPNRKESIRKPIFLSKLRPRPRRAMSETYLKAIESRRSIYKIEKKSPISDDKIRTIVTNALKYSPSPFNCQSGRAVVLLGSDHEALWAIGDAALKEALPEAAYNGLAPKVQAFIRGYGTVLFFEDGATIDASNKRNPGMPFDQWSEHSTGMLQFNVWTMFELEGLGASLQHYNFLSTFQKEVKAKWDLPEKWDLKAQLVFGQPTGGPDREKTFIPIEERLKVFGA